MSFIHRIPPLAMKSEHPPCEAKQALSHRHVPPADPLRPSDRCRDPIDRFSLLLLRQGRHVDDEAIFYVAPKHPFVSLIDLLDRDLLDVGHDVVLPAEIEHLLGLSDPPDQRTGKLPTPEDQASDVR